MRGWGFVQRFRGGLVFKAHGLLYHSTPGLRVTKKKKKVGVSGPQILLDHLRPTCSVLFRGHINGQIGPARKRRPLGRVKGTNTYSDVKPSPQSIGSRVLQKQKSRMWGVLERAEHLGAANAGI